MFNHVELDLPKLSRETIDGVRYYSVPDEEELLKLVSITSVTSHFNKEIFVNWRKRVGENSKICFCGDASQTDLQKTNEKNGIVDFLKIVRTMPSFDIIEFGLEDIVRSGLVKEYLIAKMQLGM